MCEGVSATRSLIVLLNLQSKVDAAPPSRTAVNAGIKCGEPRDFKVPLANLGRCDYPYRDPDEIANSTSLRLCTSYIASCKHALA